MGLFSSLTLLFSFLASSFTNTNTFTEGLIGQPSNLTPLISRQNEIDKAISQIIYPQLVTYNLRGDIIPSLAESWSVSDNYLEYDFKLKRGVYWSNGREINASDVIFTAQNAPEIRNVEVQQVNDYEVKFFLKEPFAPFLDVLTLKIIPQEAEIGLDPITLENRSILRKVKSGQKIDEILIYTPESAGFDFYKWKFYNSEEELKTAAMLGEIDALATNSLNNDNYYAFEYPLKGRRYGLFFNLSKEVQIFDRNTRITLAKKIDKDELISTALSGMGEVVNIPKYEFEPNLTVNYDRQVTLTVPNEDEHLQIAAYIKKAWENIGVKVNILPLPFWDLSTRVIDTKDFDILLFGQEKGRDPDEYTLWHSTKDRYPGLNISSLNNQRVDTALEMARKEHNTDKRQEYYNDFLTILDEEVPVIYLYHPTYRWYISKRYEHLFSEYLLKNSCCDGCKCTEPSPPNLYYPTDRYKLLPL